MPLSLAACIFIVYEVVSLQAKHVNDFDTGQTALAASVSHGMDDSRLGGEDEGEA